VVGHRFLFKNFRHVTPTLSQGFCPET
jgi:hypothetical protein